MVLCAISQKCKWKSTLKVYLRPKVRFSLNARNIQDLVLQLLPLLAILFSKWIKIRLKFSFWLQCRRLCQINQWRWQLNCVGRFHVAPLHCHWKHHFRMNIQIKRRNPFFFQLKYFSRNLMIFFSKVIKIVQSSLFLLWLCKFLFIFL